jgi:hypothetical protein
MKGATIMGRMLGSFADDDELDRPDLNKCPDCDCFFASDTCPLCKKVCPEEMRAGNRKPVKHKKQRRNTGSGRVTFISWYHRWWFILLMLWFLPIVGLVLLISSPHEKWKKWLVASIAIIYALLSFVGVGTLINGFTTLFDPPVNTSLSYEEYVERCEEITAEQYYRSFAEYEDKFVKVELKIVEKTQFSGSTPYAENIHYICTPIDSSDYFIILQDCLVGSSQVFIAGDIITVYGEGDEFTYTFDQDSKRIEGPCLNMAYAELTE